jgi:hypothetical protein
VYIRIRVRPFRRTDGVAARRSGCGALELTRDAVGAVLEARITREKPAFVRLLEVGDPVAHSLRALGFGEW